MNFSLVDYLEGGFVQSLILHPTPTALWYDLICQAQQDCSVQLKTDLEAYLVFLLMRFMKDTSIVTSVLGLDFLQGYQNSHPLQRQQCLKDVGDKCLLFAGLFPQRAIKKRVKLSYFIQLGRTAYAGVSGTFHQQEQLFHELCEDFTQMMALLQAMRAPLERIDLLQSYELWHETGDQQAWERLCQSTQALPCLPPKKRMN